MNAKVARTINVPNMPPVVATPKEFVDAKSFLGTVLTGCAVEHLGHRTILNLATDSNSSAPTSLFFQALGFAFDHHHPFALRPEVLGYLIDHEIAETVRRHPDSYRHLFTTHAEPHVIEIRDDTLLPGACSNWNGALAQFEGALRKHVPDGIMAAMLPEYSTWTPESRIACLITFMDAAQPWYQYRVCSMCGIPHVRLLGVPNDWLVLLRSARLLAEQFNAHLAGYFRQLLPILTTLAEQADPATPVDAEFWGSIYERESSSGKQEVTGWITTFVHYLKEPTGELVERAPGTEQWSRSPTRDVRGIRHDHFATHVSTTPFVWQHLDKIHAMRLAGGVLGVDNDDGYVTPVLSYAVVHSPQSA